MDYLWSIYEDKTVIYPVVNGGIKGMFLGYSEIPDEMRSGSELPRVSKLHSSKGKGEGFCWEKDGN